MTRILKKRGVRLLLAISLGLGAAAIWVFMQRPTPRERALRMLIACEWCQVHADHSWISVKRSDVEAVLLCLMDIVGREDVAFRSGRLAPLPDTLLDLWMSRGAGAKELGLVGISTTDEGRGLIINMEGDTYAVAMSQRDRQSLGDWLRALITDKHVVISGLSIPDLSSQLMNVERLIKLDLPMEEIRDVVSKAQVNFSHEAKRRAKRMLEEIDKYRTSK